MCQYNSEGKLKYSKGYILGQEVHPFLFEDGELIVEAEDSIYEPTTEFNLELSEKKNVKIPGDINKTLFGYDSEVDFEDY